MLISFLAINSLLTDGKFYNLEAQEENTCFVVTDSKAWDIKKRNGELTFILPVKVSISMEGNIE